MTSSGKLFSDKLNNCMIYVTGLKWPQRQISIYYKNATDGSDLVVLSYVSECEFCYTYEEVVAWFVDTLGKWLFVNLLGCSHWFMSSRVSQLKEYFTSKDQARYDTNVVSKYLDTSKIKVYSKFHKITLPRDMVFTK